MGLLQCQRLLARLATDDDLRGRFADDPVGVAVEAGLDPAEAARFAALAPGPLDEFARSLVHKRLGAVGSLLPMTRRAVGPTGFAALFRSHARDHVPVGIKKHRDDAVAFAESLARELGGMPWLADLARFEAAALLAQDPSRRWTLLRLRHHPADLARLAAEGGPRPKPRPSLVAWSRWSKSGPLRRVVLAWPGGSKPADHQPIVPGSPLKGPTISEVIQPP